MFYIFSLLLATLLTSCTSSKPQVEQEHPLKTQIVKKTPKKITSLRPAWIANPNIGGNTGAVGIVQLMDNKKKQNYIAKKLAIAELQLQKNVNITAETTNTNSASQDLSTSSISETSDTIKYYDIIQKADFSDNKNYYVWMVLKQ